MPPVGLDRLRPVGILLQLLVLALLGEAGDPFVEVMEARLEYLLNLVLVQVAFLVEPGMGFDTVDGNTLVWIELSHFFEQVSETFTVEVFSIRLILRVLLPE